MLSVEHSGQTKHLNSASLYIKDDKVVFGYY